jgi:eukaryotic-like serine/threonine-protein kinase
MSFISFLKSKFFLVQVGIAALVTFILVFIVMQWLNSTTHHGEEIEVPNLEMMTIEEAQPKLEALELDFIILDTVDFRKDFPAFSIVEQEPLANEKVKSGRKIYIKLNSNGYAAVEIPNLVEKTFRQALPTLNSIGLEVGTITYKPYLAKDMVLEMTYKGKKVQPGQKVPKTSKIDLVLGDGSISFEEIEESELTNEE